MPVNPIRGEAEVIIAGGTYVLAATMQGLAELSQTTGCTTLQALFQRLVGTELYVTAAALQAFVHSGKDADGKPLKRKEAAAAIAASFSLADTGPVQTAFMTLLAALTRKPDDKEPGDDAGNRPAAQT